MLVLPLNHVHGIANVTLCPLAVGACCEAPGGFDAVAVWERMASGDVTVFMAVPTIYARLVAAWEAADEETRDAWSSGASGLRLMVSGSAALPVSTLERWQELTGHVLLERYGMTELGMALSNTLDKRVPGHVGEPFPGVEVRVVDDAGRDVADGEPGELWCAGPRCSPSTGDARRPPPSRSPTAGSAPATSPSTIPTATGCSADRPSTSSRPAARRSRRWRSKRSCAPTRRWPTARWSASTTRSGASASPPPSSRQPGGAAIDADGLRAWGKQQLAAAKVPSRYVFVDELPRNTLGKVVKKAVAELF